MIAPSQLCIYFNPRPPCGGRRFLRYDCIVKSLFQSTSPVWRTTYINAAFIGRKHISIHVPRVEDDKPRGNKLPRLPYFNPRPPCGGRLSCWYSFLFVNLISIHVPRVEDDELLVFLFVRKFDFNPRPPCGGRHVAACEKCFRLLISIHVPRVEDDRYCISVKNRIILFQSTSPVWRTTAILH